MTAASVFRQQVTVLAFMYVGYGAMMICRQTVVIMSPAMIDDPSLGLDKASYGAIVGWGTAGALVGKLVWGPLADILGGRRTFLLGVGLSGLFIALFGFAPSAMLLFPLGFLLYGAKSAGWPALTKLVESWFHPKRYGRVWGVLSTSSRASVVVGTLALGALLSVWGWRMVALTAAAMAAALTLLCFHFLKNKPTDPEFLSRDRAAEQEPDGHTSLELQLHHPLQDTTLKQALGVFARSRRVWLIALSMAILTVLMEFLTFLPLYLKETLLIEPDEASTASAAFPAGSFAAVLVGGYVYDKLSKSMLRLVMGAMLVVAALCVVVLMYRPDLQLSPNNNYWLTIILVFVFGAAISPAYYLPMSVFSIKFGGIHSGVLISLLDAAGFAGGMVFSFVGGWMAEEWGWPSFLVLLLASAIVAGVLIVAFLHLEYRQSQPSQQP